MLSVPLKISDLQEFNINSKSMFYFFASDKGN